jgi:hypothetical protein
LDKLELSVGQFSIYLGTRRFSFNSNHGANYILYRYSWKIIQELRTALVVNNTASNYVAQPPETPNRPSFQILSTDCYYLDFHSLGYSDKRIVTNEK